MLAFDLPLPSRDTQVEISKSSKPLWKNQGQTASEGPSGFPVPQINTGLQQESRLKKNDQTTFLFTLSQLPAAVHVGYCIFFTDVKQGRKSMLYLTVHATEHISNTSQKRCQIFPSRLTSTVWSLNGYGSFKPNWQQLTTQSNSVSANMETSVTAFQYS